MLTVREWRSGLELRKELRRARGAMTDLLISSGRMRLRSLMLQRKLGRVTRVAVLWALLAFAVAILKSYVVWLIAVAKGSSVPITVAGVSGATAVAVTTASIISTSSVKNDDVEIVEPSVAVVEIDKDRPKIERRVVERKPEEPRFEPRKGTVIKIDGTRLSGTVTYYGSGVVRITVDGDRITIPQSEVFKVVW